MPETALPLHVLIVEDEALLAMDLEGMILDAGHEVVGEVRSAGELARCVVSHAPNVAFVDMHLADSSTGLQAAEIILARWPDTTIIFVTANESRVPDDFAGAKGLIGKPFSATGINLSMRYLARAISDPPPPFALPSALRLSPGAAEAWAG